MAGTMMTEPYCSRLVAGFPNATACRFYDPLPGGPPAPSPAPPVRATRPPPAKPKLHYVEDYRALVRDLIAKHPLDEAMSIAVGGHFEHFGRLQRSLLIQLGLQPHHTIADIGCGSGRLAIALSEYLSPQGVLLGTDVVAQLLDYAAARTPKTWTYKVVEEIGIPFPDAA